MKYGQAGEKNCGISRKRYFTGYTVVFLIVCGLVYSYFLLGGRSFVYDDDGWKQHYKALVYYGQWLRSIAENLLKNHTLVIPEFTFSIGYGSDILTTLHYYAIGDPLNLFSVLVPSRYMEYFYAALVIVRLYLAGFGFSCYCFYRNAYRHTAVLAGAVSYAFCGFALYTATVHPYFVNPMIYFPFLLLGVEKILKEKKPWVFIISVFVSAVSNFYFFYMLVLLTVLYVFLRLIMIYKRSGIRQAFGVLARIAAYSIIGVMMSAVILIPVVLLFLDNPRSGNTVEYSMLYFRSYYERFCSGFVTYGAIGSWNIMGYTAVALCSVVLLFLCRKRYAALKTVFLILTGFLLLPVFGSIFNGFSYVCNRWVWAYSMLVSYIMVVVWEEFTVLSRRKKAVLCGLVLCYFAYCFRMNEIHTRPGLEFAGIIALVMLGIVLISGFLRKRWQKTVRNLAVLALVVVNIGGMAYYEYSPEQSSALLSYRGRGNLYEMLYQTDALAINAVGDEGEFYRYSGDVYNTTISNSTMFSGLSSVQFYWSLSNSTIAPFMEQMCLRDNSAYNYKKLDNRTALNTLAGVKYYVTKAGASDQSANYVPYGFEQVTIDTKTAETYNVYKNRYALPLGYTYSEVILPQEYENMNAMEKQEALLQGVFLEEQPEGFEQTEPELTSEKMEYSVVCNSKHITQQGNSFVVTKADSSVTLNFEGLPQSETYVLFKSLNYAGTSVMQLYSDDKTVDPLDLYTEKKYNKLSEEKKAKLEEKERYYVEPNETVITFTAQNSGGQISYKSLEYRTPRYIWYSGRHDFAVNMCYDELPKTSVTITFPEAGIYSFDSLEVICQPMENYSGQVEALRQETLTNVDLHNDNEVFGTNEVTGTISLSEPKILCLTVPYSKGWTAYVDGEEQELLPANTMFMALTLDEGEHEIRLVYHTPGLTAGIAVSCAGIASLALLAVCYRRKNKKTVREN